MRANFGADAGEAVAERVAHAPDHVGAALERAARDHVDAARADQVEFARQRFDEIGAVDDPAGGGIAVDAALHGVCLPSCWQARSGTAACWVNATCRS